MSKRMDYKNGKYQIREINGHFYAIEVDSENIATGIGSDCWGYGGMTLSGWADNDDVIRDISCGRTLKNARAMIRREIQRVKADMYE